MSRPYFAPTPESRASSYIAEERGIARRAQTINQHADAMEELRKRHQAAVDAGVARQALPTLRGQMGSADIDAAFRRISQLHSAQTGNPALNDLVKLPPAPSEQDARIAEVNKALGVPDAPAVTQPGNPALDHLVNLPAASTGSAKFIREHAGTDAQRAIAASPAGIGALDKIGSGVGRVMSKAEGDAFIGADGNPLGPVDRVVAGATTQTPYGVVSSRSGTPEERVAASKMQGPARDGTPMGGPFDMAAARAVTLKNHPQIGVAGSAENLAFVAHAKDAGEQAAHENAPAIMAALNPPAGPIGSQIGFANQQEELNKALAAGTPAAPKQGPLDRIAALPPPAAPIAPPMMKPQATGSGMGYYPPAPKGSAMAPGSSVLKSAITALTAPVGGQRSAPNPIAATPPPNPFAPPKIATTANPTAPDESDETKRRRLAGNVPALF